MSARGATAPRPASRPAGRPQERVRPRVVTRSRRRRRLRLRIRLGLAVIPLMAMLFAGVVWLNAAELRVTKRQGEVARQMTQVQEQLALIRSTQAQSDERVIASAEKLGMIRPTSDDLTFVRAAPTP